MSEIFPLALKFTSKWEGGYVHDPVDPGGETKYGISKRAYPDIDIKSLTLQEAGLIYERDYWEKAGCPSMEKSQAIVMFDAAVNCGVGRARSWLKEVDPEVTDDKRRARWLIQRRIAYYNELVKKKPALSKFSKGWLNRVTDLSRYIDIV
jgi:lysozyme family protein